MEFNSSSGIISSSMADYKPWNKVSAYSFTLADLSLVSTTPTTMDIPESFFQEELKIGDYHYPIRDKDNQQEQKSTPCFSNNKVDEMGELGTHGEDGGQPLNLKVDENNGGMVLSTKEDTESEFDYYLLSIYGDDEYIADMLNLKVDENNSGMSVAAHGEDGGQPLNLKVDKNNDGMVLSTKEDTESEFDYYLLSIHGDDEYIADMLDLKVDENNYGMVLSSNEDAKPEFDYSLFPIYGEDKYTADMPTLNAYENNRGMVLSSMEQSLSLIVLFSLYMARTNIFLATDGDCNLYK
ncbi:hypothetical protein GH714_035609 [Hevea brasiliensis]|uniref:Uncharacterized protein n=1 Tax=Hevea brasiliensis TaxID=3981 RepID=A0A6A6KWG3_HEVBR|nr:hypothetical protein GH714_035609 [Hevea brasiliensis]